MDSGRALRTPTLAQEQQELRHLEGTDNACRDWKQIGQFLITSSVAIT